MSSLQEFAREAEQQYRRLADLAESAGVASAALALRQKADRMQALIQAGEPAYPETTGPAGEVHIVLSQLHESLSAVLQKWPPDQLTGAVNEVLAAADRLAQLALPEGESRTGVTARRRRWAALDSAPVHEPPSFPGPRKGRGK